MELAPIAEAQPSLAPFWVQSYEKYPKGTKYKRNNNTELSHPHKGSKVFVYQELEN